MNLKILLILSLWFASVSSVAKTEIDGAFGIKFGDVWTSESMYFEPEIKLPGFHYYSVKITPLSKKVSTIYASNQKGIKSLSKYEDIEEGVCNSYYRDTLRYFNDVYDNKFKDPSSGLYSGNSATYKYKQSQIWLTKSTYEGCSLSVNYSNDLLIDERSKEFEIIAKKKRKKMFKGVDL